MPNRDKNPLSQAFDSDKNPLIQAFLVRSVAARPIFKGDGRDRPRCCRRVVCRVYNRHAWLVFDRGTGGLSDVDQGDVAWAKKNDRVKDMCLVASLLIVLSEGTWRKGCSSLGGFRADGGMTAPRS
jgi:hypothetical protein